MNCLLRKSCLNLWVDIPARHLGSRCVRMTARLDPIIFAKVIPDEYLCFDRLAVLVL